MYRIASLLIVCCSIGIFLGNDWLQFRGPDSTNVVPKADLPVEIGEADHIAWKVELPGKGPAGPIIVGNRVIVSSSAGVKQDQLFISCYDVNDGSELWKREFWATGRCFCHPLSANAAPTPVSDGERIYAFYSSNDLICLDLEGNLQWYRGLGVDHPKAGHDTGMSSSPVVADGVVICQVENQSDSFAIGVDAKTGETVWEIDRNKDACWASPIVVESANGPNVMLQSGDRATLINAKTGEQVWELEGRCSQIASTSMSGNNIYLPVNGTSAFQVGQDGTFNELWSSEKVAASRASLLASDKSLFTVGGSGGIVTCFSADDGSSEWKVRVGGTHWTTPIIAGENMYLFSQEGNLIVVDVTENFEGDDADRKVYEKTFDGEVFLCSPAISGDAMYMRSDKYLYKFK